jgi:hypothetical protein
MAVTDYDDSKIIPDTTTGLDAATSLNKVGFDTQRSIKYVLNEEFDTLYYANDNSTVLVKMLDGTIQEWFWNGAVWGRAKNVLPNSNIGRIGNPSLTHDWGSVGLTETTFSLSGRNDTKFQFGCLLVTESSGTITFPVAYTGIPMVFLQTYQPFGGTPIEGQIATLYTLTATNFSFEVYSQTTTNPVIVYWMSVGECAFVE